MWVLVYPGKDASQIAGCWIALFVLNWLAAIGLVNVCAAEELSGPTDLRCEYLVDPLGIDTVRPRLSWRLEWPERGQRQTAYRVIVASCAELLEHGQADLWDSGKVDSDQSIHIEYAGELLKSEMFCYWKVQAWDKAGRASSWSMPAMWSMGILRPEDWKAKWIGLDEAPSSPPSTDEHRRLPARMLRREFLVEKTIARATTYVCGLGFFETYLNGRKVGDHVMDPALSNYAKRAFYVTFDVTSQLRQGQNALGLMLGNSRFFAPRIKVPTPTPTFGYPKLFLRMTVEYEGGGKDVVLSDEHWKITCEGPIRANNEFDGEEYDARMEQDGWADVGFDDSKWEQVHLVEPPGGPLVAQMIEPMRVTEVLRPVAVTNPKAGTYLVDFGQNLYGQVQLQVRGPIGTRIQVRTSFTKKPDGTIKMEDNRSALSTDVYVCRGKAVETWSPRFRGQGTHYAEVTGWPGAPAADAFALLVVHTDMEQVGEFTCSNDLVNKIYADAVRSIRMQERSVPLDPDRDERQAWLGHPAKTSESEGYLFNVAPFYASFLAETRLDQRTDGSLSDAGSVWPFYSGCAIWPSVVTILPDWYHDFYGDRRILEQNYLMMKRWMLCMQRRLTPDFVMNKHGYGDWVDAYTMDARVGDPGATSIPLMQTAYFAYNCRVLARVAEILGNADDKNYFTDLATKVAGGFNKNFFQPNTNCYLGETQCSYVLPLAFGLVPADHRRQVAANLADDILLKHQGHLSVGLVGMQWYMQTLSDIGRPDIAFTVLTQTTRPSWGYMIAKGGTSIWERWDQDTRDPGMNGESQLILAGNLGAWLYQTLAGVQYDPARPGFKHIILRPQPLGDLTSVTASHKCLYGTIRSAWRIEKGNFRWNVNVPPNTTATVDIPTRDADSVTESGKPAAQAEGVTFLHSTGNSAVYEVASGTYEFLARIR